jgi:hypothetical protein
MSIKNSCICLCVYNNEKGLPYVLNNIKKLDNIFNTKILVFYDHSNDKSLSILNDYNNNNNNMEIIINNNKKSRTRMGLIMNNKKKSRARTENIAFARNKLLQLIRDKYNKYEYFIMMDSNEYACVGDIKIDIIKETLSMNNWDCISFDREAGYYDTWALSFEPYIYSFFHFNNSGHVVSMMRNEFTILLNKYKQSDELMPVYSAFNGFAIYKTNKFLNCNYSANIDLSLFPLESIKKEEKLTGESIIFRKTNDCEHRHFHLEAIKKNSALIRISTKSVFSKFENPRSGLRGPC